MTAFVVDSSVTAAWIFGEQSPVAKSSLLALRETEAFVPSIWPLEVANVLAIGERTGRMKPADISKAVIALGGLGIKVDEQTTSRALGETLHLARAQRLSAYDASYLELAMREGLELATLDKALQEAAVRVGVKLFQP
jgi:predicted nucleic acid-binding protein